MYLLIFRLLGWATWGLVVLYRAIIWRSLHALSVSPLVYAPVGAALAVTLAWGPAIWLTTSIGAPLTVTTALVGVITSVALLSALVWFLKALDPDGT